MLFRKVTASKYIGENGYSLYKTSSGLYSICKDGKVTKWGTGFKTVRLAEIFLSRHDYIRATTEFLPISVSDCDFIREMYCPDIDCDSFNHRWNINKDACIVIEPEANNKTITVVLKQTGCPDKKYNCMEPLLSRLDAITHNDIFASVIYRGTELRSIFAAKKDRRSSRDITQNLVRVKSSNVWSYGVEISNSDVNIGDVYIQFKGKNGGPTGGLYKYYDVPVSLWRKFVSAPSKGHFVWKYLRNNFLYSKLDGDKRGKLPNAVN